MTEQEIKDLINSVVEKRKDKKFSYSSIFSKLPEDKYTPPDYPEYYPGYTLAIELAEANRTHAEKGAFPSRLFAFKSPHETEEELTYIKNNYKQTTLPIAVDYINTITRAFNDGNFQVIYGKEDEALVKSGQTLQNYIEKEINTFGSLENYFKMFYPTIKTIDANGVIVIKNFFNYEENEEGEITVSSTKLNEPQPVYYESFRVVAFKEEQYCLIDLSTDIDYTKKNKKQQIIYYYELHDINGVYHITYDVNKRAITEFVIYDQHNRGMLLVQKIKGIPRQYMNEIVWQSPFSFATDILDLVLIDETTINLSKKKCAFPTKVYEGSECQFQEVDSEGTIHQCSGGYIIYPGQPNKLCPSCGGIGSLRSGPLHDFIINPKKPLDGSNPPKPSDAFAYIAPDPRILEYLRTEISINEEKAKKILHLQTSNSIIKGAENLTATGMTLDEKSMNAFVRPQSDQMFDMMQFNIEAIAYLRYKRIDDIVTIIRPKSFDFKTEYDYINEISQAIKDGLPPILVQEIINRYLKSHFYTEEQISKAFALFAQTDLLLGINNDTIELENSKGIIANWQVILHNSGIIIIRDLASEFKTSIDKSGKVIDFYLQELTEQKDQLIARAKEIADANKPVENTQDIIGQILKTNGAVPAQ